jgi:3-hydroxybutyryl-CoA dehydrogenase
LKAIRNIAVIGAGTMGNGIAHVFAQNNFPVNLIDISSAQLEQAMNTIKKNLGRQVEKDTISEEIKEKAINNISTFTSIKDGVQNCDLVIEAATENEDIKLTIFKELDDVAPTDCVLSTNTSSISITKIASVTKRPSRVIGMHFMNPVPVMKLVEVINGYATDKNITNTIIELANKIGKIPCEVNDYPGFVANRILMPMINEAIYCLHQNVAGVKEIDTVMKLGMAHPMGPLQLADFIGLDVCYFILKVMHEGFGDAKYFPCPLLVNMVSANHLGVKTGKGFYQYTPGSKELVVSERFR